MAGWINGHKKVVSIAAGVAALCSVCSFIGGTYNGWTQRVEASVVVQRMVNAHDETLQKVVPKVEACHDVNERQDWAINEYHEHMASQDKQIDRLVDSLTRLTDKMDLVIQRDMRDGRIPR